ncbi:transcriptional regulator SplA domain-containing protein [Peribacillus huizhouensis]|uniref:Transcriptional regulator of the spore photoproduct lyase operon n=1 Tax=Peribacillus huizhouensis TaxID=1501239 RepID=A0ABR6CTF1_9BACI|nr:transcriptional regulator SplA domain-containing protein [Peribacillus huizhouensis]MBA9028304.1 transcriptional regulator of the spore photoproduct lyase operon [Peribacillus huizhouensis]
MELDNENRTYNAGDIVYVFYRNPHTQDVTNIQEAAVVMNPENPQELALFLYETYYPLSNELAVYTSIEQAEQDYQYYFGDVSEGPLE